MCLDVCLAVCLSYIIVTLDTVKHFLLIFMTSFSCVAFVSSSVLKYFSTLKQQTIEQLFKHFGGFWHCAKRTTKGTRKSKTENYPKRCSLGCRTNNRHGLGGGTIISLVCGQAQYDVDGKFHISPIYIDRFGTAAETLMSVTHPENWVLFGKGLDRGFGECGMEGTFTSERVRHLRDTENPG